MGQSNSPRNKNLSRPKKAPRFRRRREKVQRTRLIALGVPEDRVNRMNPLEVRRLLKRPTAIKRESRLKDF